MQFPFFFLWDKGNGADWHACLAFSAFFTVLEKNFLPYPGTGRLLNPVCLDGLTITPLVYVIALPYCVFSWRLVQREAGRNHTVIWHCSLSRCFNQRLVETAAFVVCGILLCICRDGNRRVHRSHSTNLHLNVTVAKCNAKFLIAIAKLKIS